MLDELVGLLVRELAHLFSAIFIQGPCLCIDAVLVDARSALRIGGWAPRDRPSTRGSAQRLLPSAEGSSHIRISNEHLEHDGSPAAGLRIRKVVTQQPAKWSSMAALRDLDA